MSSWVVALTLITLAPLVFPTMHTVRMLDCVCVCIYMYVYTGIYIYTYIKQARFLNAVCVSQQRLEFNKLNYRVLKYHIWNTYFCRTIGNLRDSVPMYQLYQWQHSVHSAKHGLREQHQRTAKTGFSTTAADSSTDTWAESLLNPQRVTVSVLFLSCAFSHSNTLSTVSQWWV